jgi:hypothetical protein
MILEIKRDLKSLTVKEVYNKYLLGQDVWFFIDHLKVANPSKTYDEFKYYISERLGIHFNNIAITGSAKTGISFSPGKQLRAFNEKSDLDIILVSQHHYQKFWKAYLEMFYRGKPFPEYKQVYTSIFKRFISLKNPTEKHKDIIDWVKTVNPFMKDLQLFFGIERDINYRIYDSWEAVEDYHFFGIQQLKNFVFNNAEKEELISHIIHSLIKNKNAGSK